MSALRRLFGLWVCLVAAVAGAGTFISGNAALPANRTNAPGLGPATRTSQVDADFLNTILGDLGDIRDHVTGWVNPKSYGAKCDGATDDTAALVAAATTATSLGYGIFVPCKLRIAAAGTTTITPEVRFGAGGSVDLRAGATLSLSEIQGGLHQIFWMDGGTLQLNVNKTLVGFPEWWGCVPGGPDCLAALQYAISAVPVVQLQRADYWISNVLKVAVTGEVIRGVPGIKSTGGATGMTRLISTSDTANVLQIGPDGNPGVASFPQHIRVENLEVTRSVAVVSPGESFSAPTGVFVKFTQYTYLNRVWSTESNIGFTFDGTVQSHCDECVVFRSLAAASGTDFLWGFGLVGSENIGLAGGNASSYFRDCTVFMGGAIAATGGSPIISKGWNLDTAFADTFLFRPETTAVQIGINAGGVGGNASASLRKSGNADLHIINPIIDQFTAYGILLTSLSEYAAVDVTNGYAAPASGSSPTACYAVTASNASSSYGGTVTLTSNQCIAWPATAAIGIFVSNASGVSTHGNLISGSARPIAMDTATNCSFDKDVINNPGETTSEGGVWMTASTRNYIAPIIKGGSGKVTIGIQAISTGNTNNEFNCTGIDPAVISGGSGNKLTINGVQVTTTGLSGTNLVSGVMN